MPKTEMDVSVSDLCVSSLGQDIIVVFNLGVVTTVVPLGKNIFLCYFGTIRDVTLNH